MGTTSNHPAASLPEDERTEYVHIIAAMAFVDGRTAPQEVAKLRRLADVLKLPAPAFNEMIKGLQTSPADVALSKDRAPWFKANPPIRASLMMDSIVIAFSDGKLERHESQQISSLAKLLDYSDEDIVKMARFVEKTLFGRNDEEHQALARELGASLGGGGHEHHGIFDWVRGLFED